MIATFHSVPEALRSSWRPEADVLLLLRGVVREGGAEGRGRGAEEGGRGEEVAARGK